MIGIIGGTGLYSLLEKPGEEEITTQYGKPSAPAMIGKIAGKDIAFISRHGPNHLYPPHKVPYKANIAAMHKLGVTHIISTTAVGSLKKEIKPGDFVVPDHFINFTHDRDDTFYHGPGVYHISSAEPFCPDLRKLLINSIKNKINVSQNIINENAKSLKNEILQDLEKTSFIQRHFLLNETSNNNSNNKINKYEQGEHFSNKLDEQRSCSSNCHEKGTVVVIQGPRFASHPESDFYRAQNWDVINMTIYPECMLARELEMCYANISLVTDYDSGVKDDPSIKPVSIQEVLKLFKTNTEKLKSIILRTIEQIDEKRKCICAIALKDAKVS